MSGECGIIWSTPQKTRERNPKEDEGLAQNTNKIPQGLAGDLNWPRSNGQ